MTKTALVISIFFNIGAVVSIVTAFDRVGYWHRESIKGDELLLQAGETIEKYKALLKSCSDMWVNGGGGGGGK